MNYETGGEKSAFIEGQKSGEEIGFEEGYEKGCREGYDNGYLVGCNEAEQKILERMRENNSDQKSMYDAGYRKGGDEGFQQGYAAGESSQQNGGSLIDSIDIDLLRRTAYAWGHRDGMAGRNPVYTLEEDQ